MATATKQRRYQRTLPITGGEVVRFRALICAGIEGVTEQRSHLAELLGKDPVSLWRYETGKKISDPVVLRRALVQICDERQMGIPRALRYGRATKGGDE
jgi:hypothetical protein